MSTVPAALTALAERLRVSPRIAAIQITGQAPILIQDGPWLASPSDPDVICVGWTPDEGDGVETTVDHGMGSSQESSDVICMVSSWGGDTDLVARRARTDVLLDAMTAELDADRTLGGAVTLAEVTGHAWNQYQAQGGCQVTVQVTVHIEAFRIP